MKKIIKFNRELIIGVSFLFLQIIFAIALIVVFVELMEFMVLVYVWNNISVFKYVGNADNYVIIGIAAMMIFILLSVCVVSVLAMTVEKTQKIRIFIVLNTGNVIFQLMLFYVESKIFSSSLIRDFFDAKQNTFVVGALASATMMCADFLMRLMVANCGSRK